MNTRRKHGDGINVSFRICVALSQSCITPHPGCSACYASDKLYNEWRMQTLGACDASVLAAFLGHIHSSA